MTNADKFKSIFGLYATELWAKPEKDFLEWLNADAKLFGNSEQLEKDHVADPGKMVGDLISRQAAIDALEKVAELFPWRVPGNRDSYDRYNEAWNDSIGRAEIEIEKLPSAQPEIVRCKDCKHYNAGFECLIEGYGIERNKNWYCADAERRTDE